MGETAQALQGTQQKRIGSDSDNSEGMHGACAVSIAGKYCPAVAPSERDQQANLLHPDAKYVTTLNRQMPQKWLTMDWRRYAETHSGLA